MTWLARSRRSGQSAPPSCGRCGPVPDPKYTAWSSADVETSGLGITEHGAPTTTDFEELAGASTSPRAAPAIRCSSCEQHLKGRSQLRPRDRGSVNVRRCGWPDVHQLAHGRDIPPRRRSGRLVGVSPRRLGQRPAGWSACPSGNRPAPTLRSSQGGVSPAWSSKPAGHRDGDIVHARRALPRFGTGRLVITRPGPVVDDEPHTIGGGPRHVRKVDRGLGKWSRSACGIGHAPFSLFTDRPPANPAAARGRVL
jgi:hypothetical protein